MDTSKLYTGHYGLERETLRIGEDGKLAQTAHPFDDKRLDRDFCENQLEIITPVCGSIDELMKAVTELHNYAADTLKSQGEHLWLYSNPPHIDSEDEIPVALFTGDMAFKHDYRINLWRRYGKRLMLLSGIHFNFSFDESLFDGEDKNEVYFRISKYVLRYSWLIVLLTAASPVYDKSFDGDGKQGSAFSGLGSLRNSERGYWNQFVPVLDYTDIKSYAASINEYVRKGALFSAGELYMPVRLKSAGTNSLDALTQNGVDHIELRMFDLNPLSPVGVFKEDLEFAHYFLLYLLSLPDFNFTPELQIAAVKNHKEAARFDLSEIKINGYKAVDAAMGLLDDMTEYFKGNGAALENIGLQKDKILNNNRYCIKIYDLFKDDFQNTMLNLTKKGVTKNV